MSAQKGPLSRAEILRVCPFCRVALARAQFMGGHLLGCGALTTDAELHAAVYKAFKLGQLIGEMGPYVPPLADEQPATPEAEPGPGTGGGIGT